jgi:hypothetical protein
MRSYRPTTSSVKENTKEKLVFVREGVLYGLVIEDAKVDKASINRGIVSTPNIIYYSNNTKCLIDYTNQTNQDIQKQLNEYFSQIPTGTTITLYNGTYLDVNSDIIANLSGTYVFRSYYAGIIEADVTSVTQLSTNLNRYDKTRFEQIPYLVATTIVDDYEIKSYIKNKFGINTKNSFNYLGVKVGDYIKITDISAPVKIVEIKVDSDGNEYLLLDRRVTEMDLTNKKTKIDVYFPVIDSFTDMPDITEQEVGACIEYANGVVISCTNNHTRSQCRFRSSKIKSISSELTLNTFCSTPETDTAVQRTSSDNLIQLTSTLATAISNMSNTSGVAGVVNKNGNTKNSFYGRPF